MWRGMACKETKSPLHEAVEARNVELVRSLIETGCNVNEVNSRGRTPLHFTATRPFTRTGHFNNRRVKFAPMDEEEIQRRVRIANMLIKAGAKVDSPSRTNTDLINYLDFTTALQEAALCQNDIMVELLLLHGGNVNAKSRELENTALHWAMTNFAGNKNLVKRLLEHGSDVNAVNRWGETPPHVALQHPASCPIKLIELFLERGADISPTVRATGNTVLHLATSNFRDSMDFVKTALEYTYDVNAVNAIGQTPLQLAVEKATNCPVELIELLRENGADIDVKSRSNGNTILHLAIANFKGNISLVEFLLELKHFDINAVNALAETPLFLAVKNSTKGSVELIQLLLDSGADVDAKSPTTGNTALHWAVLHFQGNTNLVKLLLEHSSDVNSVNEFGETPLHLAAEYTIQSSVELIKLLLEHGADVEKKRLYFNDNAAQMYIATEEPFTVDPMLLKLLLVGPDREENGMSPLHEACLFHQVDSVRDLLRDGADLTAKDVFGHLPMFYALISLQPTKKADKCATIRLLLDFGADGDHNCLFPKFIDEVDDREILDVFTDYATKRLVLQALTVDPLLQSREGLRLYKFVLPLSSDGGKFSYRVLEKYARRKDTGAAFRILPDSDDQLVDELRLMKETRVGESKITFLDLLDVSSGEIEIFARDKQLMRVEDFEAGKSKFVRYQGMLEASFYKINAHLKLVRDVAVALTVTIFGDASLELLLQQGRAESLIK